MPSLESLVTMARDRAASDLHLEAGVPPTLRVRGELQSVGAPITAEETLRLAQHVLGPQRWRRFPERSSADLSRTISGVRCRINAFQTVRGVSLAIRLLSTFRNNLRDCNLHPDLETFTQQRNGLVILSGPTGSGKSTTLAALIEEINVRQRRHILTIESPIEYFFQNRRSFIRQREVATHTPSFEQGIIDSMREDPDVLVIGEMRTPETMRLTLNAAETGHLVLATMHAARAAEALSRICMSFAPEIEGSIRAQLADCLLGVVSQRLVHLPELDIRVPECEILAGTTRAKAVIRKGQFSQIETVLQSGGDEGMWSFDRYARWVAGKHDWIRPAEAASREKPADLDHDHAGTVDLPVPPPAERAAGLPAEPTPASSDRIVIDEADTDLDALANELANEYGGGERE